MYAPSSTPIPESHPVAPASPYAVSKLAQEQLALQGGAEDGLDVLVARSFNHTGPGQREAFFAPGMARQIALIEAGAIPPVIHVGNLDAVRDLSDVRDVVAAYIALVRSGRTATNLQRRIGSGTVDAVCPRGATGPFTRERACRVRFPEAPAERRALPDRRPEPASRLDGMDALHPLRALPERSARLLAGNRPAWQPSRIVKRRLLGLEPHQLRDRSRRVLVWRTYGEHHWFVGQNPAALRRPAGPYDAGDCAPSPGRRRGRPHRGHPACRCRQVPGSPLPERAQPRHRHALRLDPESLSWVHARVPLLLRPSLPRAVRAGRGRRVRLGHLRQDERRSRAPA